MGTKYPREIYAIRRKTKTIGVSAYFYPAQAANEDRPLAIYDKNFSRLVVAGIDAEKQQSVSINIPISAIEQIIQTSEYAFRRQLDAVYSNQNATAEENASPAYTVQIASGTFKGKTPAQILLEMGEKALDPLRKQYTWLNSNLAKYPKNKVQMDAIQEAANLFKEGKLEENKAPEKVYLPINVYTAEARALTRKSREDGMCPVHNTSIKWCVGDDNPLVVTLSNFYAPVTKRDDGTISPQINARDEKTVKNFQMRTTAEEWLNLIRCIKAAMRQFEIINARGCLQDAEKAEKENLEAAKAAK